MNDYWVLSIPATGEHRAEAARAAPELGVDLSSQELPVVVIATDEGESVGQLAGSQLERDALLKVLRREALPPLDAQQLVDEALARAKAEKQTRVYPGNRHMVRPCWKLKRFINDHLQLFEKNYVFVALDHRWKGCQEVVASLRPDKQDRGIPWSVILDSDGNVLATSDGPEGNIGFPNSKTNIDHFMSMVTSTSIHLSEIELARVRKDLEGE